MRWRDLRRGQPGFRLDLCDLAILAAALGLCVALAMLVPDFPLWWFPGYVALSFLVFCNVLRVGTVLELPWAAAAVLSAFWTLSEGRGDPWTILIVSEPFRALAIVWSARIGWYRGILWHEVLSVSGHVPERVAFGRKPPFRFPFRRARS